MVDYCLKNSFACSFQWNIVYLRSNKSTKSYYYRNNFLNEITQTGDENYREKKRKCLCPTTRDLIQTIFSIGTINCLKNSFQWNMIHNLNPQTESFRIKYKILPFNPITILQTKSLSYLQMKTIEGKKKEWIVTVESICALSEI